MKERDLFRECFWLNKLNYAFKLPVSIRIFYELPVRSLFAWRDPEKKRALLFSVPIVNGSRSLITCPAWTSFLNSLKIEGKARKEPGEIGMLIWPIASRSMHNAKRIPYDHSIRVWLFKDSLNHCTCRSEVNYRARKRTPTLALTEKLLYSIYQIKKIIVEMR